MILYDLGSCSWYILPWGVHTAVCSNITFLSIAKLGELIWQPAHYLTSLAVLYDPASVSAAQFPNWSPPQDSAHPFLLVINLCSCKETDTLEKYFKKSNFLRHYLKWGHYLLCCCILHSVSPSWKSEFAWEIIVLKPDRPLHSLILYFSFAWILQKSSCCTADMFIL